MRLRTWMMASLLVSACDGGRSSSSDATMSRADGAPADGALAADGALERDGGGRDGGARDGGRSDGIDGGGELDAARDARFSDAPSGAGYSPGAPIFFDDFQYVVTTDAADGDANAAAFRAAGWAAVKANNVAPTYRGSGTISTTTTIPGYDGPHPVPGDPRVLRIYANGIEAAPTSISSSATERWKTRFPRTCGSDSGCSSTTRGASCPGSRTDISSDLLTDPWVTRDRGAEGRCLQAAALPG